jgi:proteasome assembly chaperone (PAC2) family protein
MGDGPDDPGDTVPVAHVEFAFRPQVSRPVFLCAFRGWNDGGEAASTAAASLCTQWEARRFAHIDPEEFFDFQVNRPSVRLAEGVTRRIEWPTCEFLHAKPGGRDVIVLLGVEPNVRWRMFTQAIVEVARELDVGLLVTLGAFLADVPHTRAAPVSAASSDPGWLEKPGVSVARYEGPTGILGVLHDAATRAGIRSLSLWGAAPHYLPAGMNPKVALALLERLRDLLDLEIDTGQMARAAETWERQIAGAIEEDPELTEYVRRLEQVSADEGGLGEVPSGESIAEELERFLRDHRERPDRPGEK